MFTQKEIQDILFLDIETVCMVGDYHDLSPRMAALWDKKAQRYMRQELDMGPEELFWEKGGIHAEFGKIVCISCGYVRFDPDGVPVLKTKSFSGDDEKKILMDFREMVDKFTEKPNRRLCAHNGKEFDFPFLGRRYLIHQIPVPFALRVQGKKTLGNFFSRHHGTLEIRRL